MLAWDQFLLKLEQELSKEVVHQWVRSLRVVRFDAGNLFLEAQDSIHLNWFEEHIRPKLEGKFLNNNLRPIRVHLSLPPSSKKLEKPPITSPFSIHPDRIDPEFTFENFLPSKENMVAYKLLSEIVPTQDRPMFNPIYLYGPSGTGKTHLLTASASLLQKKGKKIFFVRAETFTSHVVQAIRLGHMQQFRSVYREMDALLIDGIDLFARKDATQEEFFHTFNTLHTAGKQLIFTASTPPSQLKEIEARLISRFEWGISIPLTRGNTKEILQKKGSLWGLTLSEECLSFLVEKFPINPILAIQALSLRGKGALLTPQNIAILLKDLVSKEEEKAISPEKIIKTVASFYGLKMEDLLGKGQTREVAHPRQMAMYFCRQSLKLPFQKIGEIFGRDHSTVMSSVKQIETGEKKGNEIEILLARISE